MKMDDLGGTTIFGNTRIHNKHEQVCYEIPFVHVFSAGLKALAPQNLGVLPSRNLSNIDYSDYRYYKKELLWKRFIP